MLNLQSVLGALSLIVIVVVNNSLKYWQSEVAICVNLGLRDSERGCTIDKSDRLDLPYSRG
jgi:hypothetical protein